MAKGDRTRAYRARVEGELLAMGYGAKRLRWAPGKLLVVLGDELREVPLHACQSMARTERELGKLEAWAEVHGYSVPAKIADAITLKVRKPRERKVDPNQIDLEQLIAAQSKANGELHVNR